MMDKTVELPRGQTTTDLLADALREAIRLGQFQAGEDLTQESIATRYRVSRIPVREAMRRLEAEGLITFHANRGAIVTQLSSQDVREIYELRMLLEGDLMERAVPAMTAKDLEKAERIHEALESEKDPKEQDALNRAFHHTLYAPAQRPRQEALVENLRNLVERYQDLGRSLMKSTPAFQKDHKSILKACRQRNPKEARTRLIQHLTHAARLATATK